MKEIFTPAEILALTPEELETNKDLRQFVAVKCNGDEGNLLKDSTLFKGWDNELKVLPGLGLITLKDAAEFFEADYKAVSEYLRSSKPEYRKELIDAGTIHRKGNEIIEMLKNQQKMASVNNRNQSNVEKSTNYKIIKNGPNNAIQLENGSLIKLNNGDQWLLTFEALTKLGFFMTGTPLAVKFRTKAIEAIKLGTHNLNTLKYVQNEILRSDIITTKTIEKVLMKVTATINHNDEEFYITVLNNLDEAIKELDNKISEIEKSKDEDAQELLRYEYAKLSTLHRYRTKAGNRYSMFQQADRKRKDIFLDRCKTGDSKNLSDILSVKKNLSGYALKQEVKAFKDELVKIGIFSYDEIKKNYVPTKSFSWLFPAAGFLSETKTAQLIKLNSYGELWLDVVLEVLDDPNKNNYALSAKIQEEYENEMYDLFKSKNPDIEELTIEPLFA